MEESDDEYIPSSDEVDFLVSHPPREKSMGKSQYPFKCKELDKRFLKSLLIIAKHFPKHNMSVFSALKYSHHLKSIQDTLRNKIKINPEKIFS